MTDKTSKFAGSALHNGFATSKDAEQNGVWRIHSESGMAVKIRRATLPDHKRALRKHYKPFAHLTRIDPVDESRVKMRAAAEVLVADWGIAQFDDLQNPIVKADGSYEIEPFTIDGEEVKPTESNVLEAFTDMPDFFAWVSDEADTFEHYRIEVVAAAGGNSARSSAGNGSGETQPLPRSSNVEQPEEPRSPPSNAAPS